MHPPDLRGHPAEPHGAARHDAQQHDPVIPDIGIGEYEHFFFFPYRRDHLDFPVLSGNVVTIGNTLEMLVVIGIDQVVLDPSAGPNDLGPKAQFGRCGQQFQHVQPPAGNLHVDRGI